MNQLNSLIIEGNAVRKAEFSEPKTGFYVCRFPVAVNRWYKNKNNEGVSEVSFFDVEAYGKVAETCNRKVDKGTGLRIVGRLKQDRWKDKEGNTLDEMVRKIAAQEKSEEIYQKKIKKEIIKIKNDKNRHKIE